MKLLNAYLLLSLTIGFQAFAQTPKEVIRSQATQDHEVSVNLQKRIVGAVVTGGLLAGAGLSNVGFLNKTGLNVSLGLAAIPATFAFALTGKEKEIATKMALKVPMLGALGSLVTSNFVMKRILGNVKLFNIHEIAAKIGDLSASQGAAIFITSVLAYNIANPLCDKIAQLAKDKVTDPVEDYCTNF